MVGQVKWGLLVAKEILIRLEEERIAEWATFLNSVLLIDCEKLTLEKLRKKKRPKMDGEGRNKAKTCS